MSSEEIIQLISECKLDRLSSELQGLLSPAVTIDAAAAEDELPVGISKVGGIPDLPPGWEWPKGKPGKDDKNSGPLSFLAQIDLAEVGLHDAEKVLPPTGYLYFFYDYINAPWGFDPDDRGSWSVQYYEGAPDQLRRAAVPAGFDDGCLFNECQLEFAQELTLPADGASQLMTLRLSEEEKERYVEFADALHGCCDEAHWSNRLLGYPDSVQDPNMHVECQLASNGINVGDPTGFQHPRVPELAAGADNWRLLFQLDSIDEAAMMWGDCGMLYFWIERDRLARKDFSNVWLILQCY